MILGPFEVSGGFASDFSGARISPTVSMSEELEMEIQESPVKLK